MGARLTVKHFGEVVVSRDLTTNHEYIAGRGADCDIRLPDEKGISRQHLKISWENDAWVVTVLSRYNRITHQGKECDVLRLEHDQVFGLKPFEIFFETNIELKPTQQQQHVVSSLAVTHNHRENADSSLEATAPGLQRLIPLLRIRIPDKKIDEYLKLEGQLWVGGRDPSCEIYMDHPHMSRRHFELTQTTTGLFITDLDSANGTSVNGADLIPHEPRELKSGDQIQIKRISITLELRNPEFATLLQNALTHQPAANTSLPQDAHGTPWATLDPYHVVQHPPLPAAHPTRLHWFHWQELKKNRVRVAILALIPLFFLGLLLDTPPPKEEEPTVDLSSSSVAFEKLSSEKKNAIRDSYNLAKGLYTDAKYELCLSELSKLHEMIPMYQDSKLLEANCTHGKERFLEQVDRERQEAEQRETELQIRQMAEICRSKLKDMNTISEVMKCLGPVVDLDPEHPLFMALIDEVKLKEQAAEAEAERKRAYVNLISQGKNKLERAQSLHKQGELAKAIEVYESYLQGNYPDTNGQRKIANIAVRDARKDLNEKLKILIASCKELSEKRQYKSAVEKCDEAIKEDPSHKEARNLKTHTISNLRREMKAIYEDSVLEESLGNVDGAKEKWKKILDENIPNDEYSNKAKIKLQKYGIGI